MRVLFLIPHRTSFDRTITFRFTSFGEVFDFVQKQSGVACDLLDCDVSGFSLRHLYQQLLNNDYNLIVLWCELVADTPASIEYFHIIREILPHTKVCVYGDGPLYIPQLFRHYQFDAILRVGDPEAGILSYLRYVQNGGNPSQVANFEILHNQTYLSPTHIDIASAETWGFPPLDLLPIKDYEHFLSKRFSYAKSLARADMVAVTVAKGCTYSCHYCPTPLREGRIERHRPIDQLIDWLKWVGQTHSLIHLFAPIFTSNEAWVQAFCASYLKHDLQLHWRATVRADQLNEELVRLMARSGCESLMFGVENLSATRPNASEKVSMEELRSVSLLLRRYGINAKAYIMLGYPRQNRDDILFTISTLKELGIVIRPTGYTPFYMLTSMPVDKLLVTDLLRFDKKTFYNPEIGLTQREFYSLLLRDFDATY